MFITVNAQLQHLLPTSSDTYFSYVSIADWLSQGELPPDTPYKIWLEGDTIINSKTYTKVFRQKGITPSFEEADYYAAVREDIKNEKIYVILDALKGEKLLYDFSLQVGETANVWTLDGEYVAGPGFEVVARIGEAGTVMIEGEPRRFLRMGDGVPVDWIEGIGSTGGFLTPVKVSVDTGFSVLLCAISKGESYYTDREDQFDCQGRKTLSTEEYLLPKINFYPTVTSSIISVSREQDNKEYHFDIFSMTGQKIKRGILSKEIDVSFLSVGLYYLVVTDAQINRNRVVKFIKK